MKRAEETVIEAIGAGIGPLISLVEVDRAWHRESWPKRRCRRRRRARAQPSGWTKGVTARFPLRMPSLEQ